MRRKSEAGELKKTEKTMRPETYSVPRCPFERSKSSGVTTRSSQPKPARVPYGSALNKTPLGALNRSSCVRSFVWSGHHGSIRARRENAGLHHYFLVDDIEMECMARFAPTHKSAKPECDGAGSGLGALGRW
jgi:hypothetical protein